MNKTPTVLKPKPHEETIGSGIADRDTGKLARYLSHAIADTYILYLQTQGAHWNVVGPLFYSLHKLTDKQYKALAKATDSIAERIRAIGHVAPASFKEFEELSILTSAPVASSAEKMLQDLVTANEKIADRMRRAVAAAEEVDDVYTADMLIARVGAHEEAAWMLRSLLAK